MSTNQNDGARTDVSDAKKVSINEKNLVISFIQFMRNKVAANDCTPEQTEAMEVSIQCLESAFDISDKNYAFQTSKPLLDIFVNAEGLSNTAEDLPTPTQAEIDQANKLKEEGNELVKSGKLDEAVIKYNEAIKLNRDPIYFCNRAAAYCRLEQYDMAIQDCRTALALDPKYAKAYGRMGVAFSCQNRYQDAVNAYKEALKIDSSNASYQQNLAIAEEKVRETGAAFGNNSNPMAGLAGIGNILNNPQMMEMATQMIGDPNVQNIMSQMMSTFMGGGGAPGAPGAPEGGAGAGGVPPTIDGFLRAGEAMAQRMEQSNPDLVAQLRRAFGDRSNADSNENNNGNNPPSS